MDRHFSRTDASGPAPFRNLLLSVCLVASLLAGCRTINRRVTEAVLHGTGTEKWHIHYGSTHRYTLDDSSLDEIEFAGTIDANHISVSYQRGLADQAQRIADRTTELLGHVQQRIGMEITTNSTIQLLRLDEAPQNFSIRLTVEPNEFPLPMFVPAGDESYDAILAHNRSYPYLFVHELIETSLVAGTAGGRVLPDLGWGALGLTAHLNNYTRWFRDGLANYAGFVACRILAEDLARSQSPQREDPLLHDRPFSSLSRIGARLFSWPQSSHSNHEKEYYNAALGLFLLIADRFGEQAIRDIMAEVTARDAVDRHDLLKITNQIIGADIKKLAANFRFLETGLELKRLTPARALNEGISVEKGLFVAAVEPNSPADRAGLRPKDTITAAADTNITNRLDLEMALFQAQTQTSVPLTIHRAEEQPLTLHLPLDRTP